MPPPRVVERLEEVKDRELGLPSGLETTTGLLIEQLAFQGGLPPRLAATVARLQGVGAVVSVANGTVWLPADRQAPAGMAIPIDVSADPRSYTAAMPAAAALMSQLGPGRVVLSVDGARLRGLHVGDLTVVWGVTLRVTAIGPDSVVGAAEMFVCPTDGRRLRLPRDRYLLVLPTSSTGRASR